MLFRSFLSLGDGDEGMECGTFTFQDLIGDMLFGLLDCSISGTLT